jgi:pimeloyl-ACP methyl ester carboxylesterase
VQPISPELYPFEGKRIDLGGHGYHYLDEGQGAPVLMVHGNPTWSFYYRNLVKALTGPDTPGGPYRAIVPDHIGCGMSDKPSADAYPYTLKQRVEDLEALLEHLDIQENLTLVVHDWGGMIGMAVATRRPERIKRVVVLNTAAFHLPKSKPMPWALWMVRTPLGPLVVQGLNAFSGIAARVCVKRAPLSREVRKAYTAPYDSWANRIATLRFVQDIPLREGDIGHDLVTQVQESLPQLAGIPVLICWGLRDFVFDHHFLDEWERRVPHAEVHRFDDCGHYILEDASDEVIAHIRSFLERNPIPAT